MILRELYQHQLAEEKKEEEQAQTVQTVQTEEAVPQKLYDSSLDEESSVNTENEMKAEQVESSSAMPPAEAEKPIQSEQSEQSPILNQPEVTEDLEEELKSVFKNQHETSHDITLDMFKINDVLDNIVKNEETPEVPPDISSQLEKEQAPEELLKQYSQADESAESDAAEEEILAKSMTSDKKPEVDFLNEQNEDGNHPDISPQAVELLGKNFDFDALLNKEPKNEPDMKNTAEQAAGQSVAALYEQSIAQKIPVHEIGLGIYQADGVIITASSALFEQLSGKQDIVSTFPANFIQDTVIEPDEAARKYNFTAESQPMFVRHKKRNHS